MTMPDPHTADRSAPASPLRTPQADPSGESEQAKAALPGDGPVEPRLHFDWRIIANGRLYRPVMRVMHRLGWCYPEATAVEPGFVWCHWCGMRGRRTVVPIGGSPAGKGPES